MKPVLLPDYAADAFASPRDTRPPAAEEQSLKRVYRLIGDALQGVSRPQWKVDGVPGLCSPVADEPYGLERFPGGFCVYAEERGRRSMLAIFDDANLAAKYFVWQVSGGQRKIDWSKFLEMEP